MNLIHDLRYGLRTLIRQPLFTLVAVLVLGLGVGANTAVFSVIDTVLLRPLPYPQADQLVYVREQTPEFPRGSVSLPNYLDWRAAQRGFTDLAIFRRNNFNLSFQEKDVLPERINGAVVSANFLTVLGTVPAMGRNFIDAEDTPGGPKAVLISDALWRRHFAADPGAVGRRVTLDGVLYEIVGVLPAQMRYPRQTDILLPLGDVRQNPNVILRANHSGWSVLGRLKSGMTLPLATEDLNAIARTLEQRFPNTNTSRRVNTQRLLDAEVGAYRDSLYLLLGVVGCVLLIACANVANLQLARATARRKEMAVRAALGASRGRLVGQLLAESGLLGLLGGVAGVVLALWAVEAIVALSPQDVPRFHEVRLDWRALLFMGIVAVGSGLLVGAFPAWRMSRLAAMATALHEGNTRGGSGGAAQGRARAFLVVAQLALTVVLLAGAGLTLKSFWRIETEPLGFRPDGVLLMSVALPESRYDHTKAAVFYDQLLARVRALPGVASAATGWNLPFDGVTRLDTVHVTGTPPDLPGREQTAENNFASPGYFETMGMPMLRGRDFASQDANGQGNAVIIDETFARRFFPGQDPVGRHVDDSESLEENPPPLTIVGVVPRTRNGAPGENLFQDNAPQMHRISGKEPGARWLVVRTASGDPMRLAEPVRHEVLALDPEVPVAQISTMEQNIAAGLASQRLTLVLLATFALLALVLASLGLYGVMALGVTQRTRELGIRLALGAQRGAVLRLVLGQSARLVGLGLSLGLVAALAGGRLLANIIYGASAVDFAVLGCVALLLSAVGLLASYLPARRATKIDPLTALREE